MILQPALALLGTPGVIRLLSRGKVYLAWCLAYSSGVTLPGLHVACIEFRVVLPGAGVCVACPPWGFAWTGKENWLKLR